MPAFVPPEAMDHSWWVSRAVWLEAAGAKPCVARAIGSRALPADAMETSICAYLSPALVAGLDLDA